MEFAILTPIVGLERYATLSKTHLLLCQIENPTYWAFYNKRRESGDFLILDNGSYEGKEDWKRLLECIRIVKPQVAILPDYLIQNWHKTVWAAERFLDAHYYEFPDVQWMFVPQAEEGDMVGFVQALFSALDDERISWIGLPRALCYSITNDKMIRAHTAEQIHKRSSRVKIHALGMVKGNVAELNVLRNTGCVTSIDSNAPVWRGWCGFNLHDYWEEKPIDYENQFLPKEDALNHHLILSNLETCGVKCANANVRAGTGSTV